MYANTYAFSKHSDLENSIQFIFILLTYYYGTSSAGFLSALVVLVFLYLAISVIYRYTVTGRLLSYYLLRIILYVIKYLNCK